MSPNFYLLAALTLAGGLASVLLKHLVHCALAVTVAFAGLALLFLELDAQFAGFAQILVYIGAVAILIVFAILLTHGSNLPKGGVFSPTWLAGLVIAAGVFASSRMGSALERQRRSAIEYRPLRYRARRWNRARGSLCTAARDRRSASHSSDHWRSHRGHARKERGPNDDTSRRLSSGRSAAVRHWPRRRARTAQRQSWSSHRHRSHAQRRQSESHCIFGATACDPEEALTGMMFAIFSIAVAAAEAAVGLGLVIAIYRHTNTTGARQDRQDEGVKA